MTFKQATPDLLPTYSRRTSGNHPTYCRRTFRPSGRRGRVRRGGRREYDAPRLVPPRVRRRLGADARADHESAWRGVQHPAHAAAGANDEVITKNLATARSMWSASVAHIPSLHWPPGVGGAQRAREGRVLPAVRLDRGTCQRLDTWRRERCDGVHRAARRLRLRDLRGQLI